MRCSAASGHGHPSRPGTCPGGGRSDRVPGDAQEHRRGRRHRDAPLRIESGIVGGLGGGLRIGEGQFQGRRPLPGEARGPRPPRGGADLRRRRGPGRGPGRTRLLRPTAQPEGVGGIARARPLRRNPSPAPGGRPRSREIRILPLRRHGGVRAGRGFGPILVPGGQHAPAGGARGHGGDLRRGPRGVDGGTGLRRPAPPGFHPPRSERSFPAGPHLRRGSFAELPTVLGSVDGSLLPRLRARRDLGAHRNGGATLVRPHARQDHRPRAHPSRGHRVHGPGARPDASGRHHHQHRVSATCPVVARLPFGAGVDRNARGPGLDSGHGGGPGRRSPDHHPGLARAPGTLERGDPAFGTHGRPFLPDREPGSGQSRGDGGTRVRAQGPDPEIESRHDGGPDRR